MGGSPDSTDPNSTWLPLRCTSAEFRDHIKAQYNRRPLKKSNEEIMREERGKLVKSFLENMNSKTHCRIGKEEIEQFQEEC